MDKIEKLQTNLGALIRRLRLEKTLSLEDVAERAGLAEKSVRNLEAGRGTTTETLFKVLTLLSATELLNHLAPELDSETPTGRRRAPRRHGLTTNTADFAGRWAEPEGTPQGELVWQDPGRAGLGTHVALVEGKTVATIRRHLNGECTVRITGWVWAAPAEDSTADKLGIKETPIKAFATLTRAKKAVEYAMSEYPGEHHSENASS
jgi:transcriptional regulator with XRE-family HTH domain